MGFYLYRDFCVYAILVFFFNKLFFCYLNVEKKSVYLWRQSSSVKTWCANSAKSCIQLVSTHSAESYASYAARTYRDVDDTARNGNGRVINLATICARACRFVISRSDFTPA